MLFIKLLFTRTFFFIFLIFIFFPYTYVDEKSFRIKSQESEREVCINNDVIVMMGIGMN